MEIVKKNLVSIICGVVALLAAISLLWPVAGMYDSVLTNDLTPSIRDGTNLVSLRRQVRLMPLLTPDDLEQKPLPPGVFPTEDIIKAGREAVSNVDNQSKKMMDAAETINGPHVTPDLTSIHELLVEGSLPGPKDSNYYALQFQFVNKYQQQTANLKEWKDICNPSDLASANTDYAHADQSVSVDEMNAAMDKLKQDITAKNWPEGGKPTPAVAKLIEDEYAADLPSVRPRLDRERADATTVYIEKDALPIDPNIAADKTYPKPDEIWDAQLTYWVLDDVCRALARANQGDSPLAPMPNVREAAVKRIVNITSPTPILASTSLLVDSALKSGDVKTNNTTTVVLDPTVSATGHVCNGMYDVVDFKMTLIVDAAKLPQILHWLEDSQFVTVLGMTVDDVPDPGVQAVKGYIYGKKPVLQIEVDCEEIFMKSWTNGILPPDRQFGLGPERHGAP